MVKTLCIIFGFIALAGCIEPITTETDFTIRLFNEIGYARLFKVSLQIEDNEWEYFEDIFLLSGDQWSYETTQPIGTKVRLKISIRDMWNTYAFTESHQETLMSGVVVGKITAGLSSNIYLVTYRFEDL